MLAPRIKMGKRTKIYLNMLLTNSRLHFLITFSIFIIVIGIVTFVFFTKEKNRMITVFFNKIQNIQIPRTQKVYIGFALENVTAENLKALESTISHPYTIVMMYKQWGNSKNSSITQEFLELFDKANKIPMITWEPWDPTKGVDQPDFQLKKIINGSYDAYIKTTAENIRSYGKPIFLRFAHEMNASWYPWSGEVNQNTPKDYIAAWRHVYALFSTIGVKNVTWVWSPNTQADTLEKYYPGDKYVDWVGLDGYNWGKTKPGKTWQSFSEIFLDDYLTITSFTKKPVMIAEMASTELNGSKHNWIEDAYENQIPNNFPQVTAVIWFNIEREVDWPVTSSESTVNVFKKVLSLDVYKTPLHFMEGKVIPAPNRDL